MAIPLVTPQVNTLSPENAPTYPGDAALERRIEQAILWNSATLVYAAENLLDDKYHLGGHTATPASTSTLFLVGLLHHFRAKDHIYYQGHASPWIYGFHYLTGKLSLQELQSFRRLGGLPSYPHPFLRPDLWENATVSMGLAPLFGIFQAKFERYLQTALHYEDAGQRIWVSLGDGESEEPEVLGCARVAARHDLDRLCFLVNVNHQSLDGPVQGGGSVIRELEGAFSGMGWNVVKLLWGEKWDRFLAADRSGATIEWLNRVNDGTLLASIGLPAEKARDVLLQAGLPKPLADLSPSELQTLMRDRGGHSAPKIHQAMLAAESCKGRPTVILAQTIKGYRIPGGEARYPNHKLIPTKQQLEEMAKDFTLAVDLRELEPRAPGTPLRNPFYRFDHAAPEFSYL